MQRVKLAKNVQFKRFSSSIPLDCYYPAPSGDASVQHQARHNVAVTVLPNGFTVVSQNHEYEPVSNVSLYVKSGSKYETHENRGANHFLKHMMFKNTNAAYHKSNVFANESNALNLSASFNREYFVLRSDCLQQSVQSAVYLMADSARNLRVIDMDVSEQRDLVKRDIEATWTNPTKAVNELLHAAAFRGCSLAESCRCPIHQASRLSAENVASFMNKHFQPSRMVLVATNAESHESLVEIASKYFADMQSDSNVQEPAGKYTGGDVRNSECSDSDKVFFALGYKGASSSSAEYHAAQVLATLIGGEAISYSDAGIIALSSSALHTEAGQIAKKLHTQVKKLSESVDEAALASAKSKVAVSFNDYVATRFGNTQFLAAQAFATKLSSSAKPHDEVRSAISKVSAADVKKLAQNMLSSKVSVAAYGPAYGIPIPEEL